MTDALSIGTAARKVVRMMTRRDGSRVAAIKCAQHCAHWRSERAADFRRGSATSGGGPVSRASTICNARGRSRAGVISLAARQTSADLWNTTTSRWTSWSTRSSPDCP